MNFELVVNEALGYAFNYSGKVSSFFNAETGSRDFRSRSNRLTTLCVRMGLPRTEMLVLTAEVSTSLTESE